MRQDTASSSPSCPLPPLPPHPMGTCCLVLSGRLPRAPRVQSGSSYKLETKHVTTVTHRCCPVFTWLVIVTFLLYYCIFVLLLSLVNIEIGPVFPPRWGGGLAGEKIVFRAIFTLRAPDTPPPMHTRTGRCAVCTQPGHSTISVAPLPLRHTLH